MLRHRPDVLFRVFGFLSVHSVVPVFRNVNHRIHRNMRKTRENEPRFEIKCQHYLAVRPLVIRNIRLRFYDCMTNPCHRMHAVRFKNDLVPLHRFRGRLSFRVKRSCGFQVPALFDRSAFGSVNYDHERLNAVAFRRVSLRLFMR